MDQTQRPIIAPHGFELIKKCHTLEPQTLATVLKAPAAFLVHGQNLRGSWAKWPPEVPGIALGCSPKHLSLVGGWTTHVKNMLVR